MPEERVPVGLYINPVRGLILIGLAVILLLILTLALIPEAPTRPGPSCCRSTPRARRGDPGRPSVDPRHFFGSAPGTVPRSRSRRCRTTSWSPPLADPRPNLSRVRCTYDLADRTYTCALPIPADVRTDGTAYLITVKALPAAGGVQGLEVSADDGPVVEPVDASTTNPITVRSRSAPRPGLGSVR